MQIFAKNARVCKYLQHVENSKKSKVCNYLQIFARFCVSGNAPLNNAPLCRISTNVRNLRNVVNFAKLSKVCKRKFLPDEVPPEQAARSRREGWLHAYLTQQRSRGRETAQRRSNQTYTFELFELQFKKTNLRAGWKRTNGGVIDGGASPDIVERNNIDQIRATFCPDLHNIGQICWLQKGAQIHCACLPELRKFARNLRPPLLQYPFWRRPEAHGPREKHF